ncbi:MAG: thioredoxin family protein [Anaerohalosphaeraceae bacterium]|nr:thioredoxin family protein [Anaerohalosphaeraceae bacterium]
MKRLPLLKTVWPIIILSFFCLSVSALEPPEYVFENDAVKVWVEWQHDQLAIDSNSTLAIHFETSENWHFYADAKSAPAPNLYLQIDAKAQAMEFGKPIFPFGSDYFDKTQNKTVRVYSKNFTVYLPFKIDSLIIINGLGGHNAEVNINGAYCSDIQCRILAEELLVSVPPVLQTLSLPKFQLPKQTIEIANTPTQDGSLIIILTKLTMAVFVGLLFNVMPCVLPVMPLIITKLLNQSKESKSRSLALGFAFCFGILMFFVALAILNIVLKVGFGTAFQWADYMRLPWFIKSLSLLLIFLGLFMFGLFSIAIPSSVTSKTGSGEGFAGALGMGFLAALLSTPCTFGILVGLIAWAQTQNLIISTAVFLLMGIGMTAPYAILILIPGLLKSIPKPGNWMERIKQAMGFVLIFIAVKLLEALTIEQIIGTLYFAVFLSIAVWMWGSWVDFNTPEKKKYIVRLIAVAIIVAAGCYFLPVKQGVINWNKYDATAIEKARKTGQAVLIKFDANWCATCKVVEKRIYKDKNIADIINSKDILIVKGDTTTKDMPATAVLQNIYNEQGVPVTIILLPGIDRPIKLRGLINKNDIKEVLEQIKEKPVDDKD